MQRLEPIAFWSRGALPREAGVLASKFTSRQEPQEFLTPRTFYPRGLAWSHIADTRRYGTDVTHLPQIPQVGSQWGRVLAGGGGGTVRLQTRGWALEELGRG